MDFTTLADADGNITNPYAATNDDGTWVEGTTSADFLDANFGSMKTATEMKAATQSEGLQKFFDYLVSQGKLTA